MTKLIYLLLVACFTVNCAKGGGPSVAGNPTEENPPDEVVCKPINSVWTSETDLEQFDLTDIALGVTTNDFQYTAHDGLTCGHVGNPNHDLSIELIDALSLDILVPYDFHLKMRWTLAMGGQCATWSNTDMSVESNVYVQLSCNRLVACRSEYSTDETGCKIFR